ncbi:MAG: peptidoglycan-binding protein [Clostridia bacterium]|nr:peptidoglycan-binding protein [Clostridia bacterium]
MTERDFYIGKPIRSLQVMLRTIAKAEGKPPAVVPDGIYGEDTVKAVSAFQSAHRLPVTGQTDNQTWNMIADCYTKQAPLVLPPEPMHILWQPMQVIRPGEQNIHLYIIQAMLLALYQIYPELPEVRVSGSLDEATEAAVLWLQEKAGLEKTGVIDQILWSYLTKFYCMSAGDGCDCP